MTTTATFCAVCGGVYKTRKDGTIRKHERFQAGGTYGWSGRVPCEGSGQPPKAAWDREGPSVVA